MLTSIIGTDRAQGNGTHCMLLLGHSIYTLDCSLCFVVGCLVPEAAPSWKHYCFELKPDLNCFRSARKQHIPSHRISVIISLHTFVDLSCKYCTRTPYSFLKGSLLISTEASFSEIGPIIQLLFFKVYKSMFTAENGAVLSWKIQTTAQPSLSQIWHSGSLSSLSHLQPHLTALLSQSVHETFDEMGKHTFFSTSIILKDHWPDVVKYIRL